MTLVSWNVIGILFIYDYDDYMSLTKLLVGSLTDSKFWKSPSTAVMLQKFDQLIPWFMLFEYVKLSLNNETCAKHNWVKCEFMMEFAY